METKNPYVIAEDIRTISRFGDYHVRDIVARYISQSLLLHCKQFVSDTAIMLYEKELTAWITKMTPPDAVIKTATYTDELGVSQCSFSLKTMRVFDENFNKVTNHLAPRQGFPPLNVQLVNLGKFNGHILVDDIILRGWDCKEIIEMGNLKDVIFNKIIACVTSGEGKKNLESKGIRIISRYHFETPIDIVCQRDFIPGLSFCGRAIIIEDNEYRYAPRLLPWGNPTEWASVPIENAVSFSKACISTAIEFWEEVYPSVRFFEVPAVIYDPKINQTNLRFVDYLHHCYKAL